MAEFESGREIGCNNYHPWHSIGRFIVSLISVFITQFALFLISYFFSPLFSPLTLLLLSFMALLSMAAIWKLCKRFINFRASAPSFVFLNILFIWFVYFLAVRSGVSSLLDFTFNGALAFLVVGLYIILSSDPGFVKDKDTCFDKLELEPSICAEHLEFPSEYGILSAQRIRYCMHCKVYVKGFDHHCPAFGNCIGQNNRVLFIVLLVGFLLAETLYILSSYQIVTMENPGRESSWAEVLTISTRIFSLLQVFWQVVFLIWHIYCICVNIRTDEWINWKSYPEFQTIVELQPGRPQTRFTNPYNKGAIRNLKEFVTSKG